MPIAALLGKFDGSAIISSHEFVAAGDVTCPVEKIESVPEHPRASDGASSMWMCWRAVGSAERLDRILVALGQDSEPAAGSLPAGQQATDLNTRFFAMPGAVELAGAFGRLPTSQRRALVNLALAMAAAASNPHRRS